MKVKLNTNEVIQIENPEDIFSNEKVNDILKNSDYYRYEHLHRYVKSDVLKYTTHLNIFDTDHLEKIRTETYGFVVPPYLKPDMLYVNFLRTGSLGLVEIGEIVDYEKQYRGFSVVDEPYTIVRTPKVFVICTVRNASEEVKKKLEIYADGLESAGRKVYLPHGDTNQNDSSWNICTFNTNAIRDADEVHVFYSGQSQGTHFDLGVAFALGKKLVVVENEQYGEGKSFPRMLDEWQTKR